jgi:N,N-dimethylformamidase
MQPAIVGYCDPWSARPGETISFKVSSVDNRPFTSAVVRIRHGDPNPAGPGMKLIPVPGLGEGRHDGLAQVARPGSYGHAPAPRLPENEVAHFVVNVRCLKYFARPQCLMALQERGGGARLGLGLHGGELVLLVSSGEDVILPTGLVLGEEAWHGVSVGFDPVRAEAHVGLVELAPRRGAIARGRAVVSVRGAWPEASILSLASFGALLSPGAALCFDGQLEAPRIGIGPAPDLIESVGALGLAPDRTLAAWDFASDITLQVFADRGPAALHGAFVNLPTRAMKGSNWAGREMAWRHAPDEYGAVHFHSDDVGDVGWRESLRLTVPEDLPSGVYALRVDNGLASDQIPFFVLPHAKRRSKAKIVYLASTLTYLAYANHARGNWDAAFQARAAAWGATPNNPDQIRDFGFSTYNSHPDGSGVALSSRRRPVLSMRPGYLTFPDSRGSGLRHFPADSHLTDWLEEKGFAFDVVTDEDLDAHGVDLIRDYPLIVTGSHPEYHTAAMLNALELYRAGGGNLCYLGGNGFYWRIARSSELPWAMEIRRAESGIRTWAAEPGEYYNQFDGAYGGLWRRNGRPPQALAEIGFAVQGLFEGSPYRRTPASTDPAVAWIFDGVEGDMVGDFGLSGGGAAGFELDQVSRHLGTSDGTVVLARSEGHGPSFLGVPEDILTHTLAVGGKVEIEAHMAYGCNDAGGQIFSTGSITFCGSLSHDGYNNPVSRILENVVRRFSGEER